MVDYEVVLIAISRYVLVINQWVSTCFGAAPAHLKQKKPKLRHRPFLGGSEKEPKKKLTKMVQNLARELIPQSVSNNVWMTYWLDLNYLL